MFDQIQSPGLPLRVGVGYKAAHFEGVTTDPGPVGWLEIHAENYMGDGGRPLAQLDRLARDFPISVHGVGLSIGGEAPPDPDHLHRLKVLCDRIAANSFSEHLAWSSHDTTYLNDLLPLPYTEATLDRVAGHIETVQQHLGRRMLLENPSSYLAFADSTMSETTFLDRLVRRTECGLLLDINNVFISATNLRTDALSYIEALPLDAVGEVHLGGHDEDEDEFGQPLLIDSHGCAVEDAVWTLYAELIDRAGPRPTLIEWDNDVPDWPTLRAEASRAEAILAPAR